jgi:hypothetical protein
MMNPFWKDSLWKQFGAASQTLENAISACPPQLWQARLWRASDVKPEFTEFWYIAFHTIFWLDFYSSASADEFAPPAPFTLSEFGGGELPERVYTKQELLMYLDYAREKCRKQIENLTDETQSQQVRPHWRIETITELLLYSMRHVQEHAAHLSMLIGQHSDTAPGWVGQA